MSGFAMFARKETREILRTWRIWVLPGILAFFALTGPPMARYTREIVTTFAGDQLGGITLPEPTYLDAYAQWAKNLTQIAVFVIVIIYGGIVSAETRSGTAVLVLTKPVSRTGFVVVKALVNAAFVTLLAVLGAAVTWAMTALMFGPAPAGPLLAATGAWVVLGIVAVAGMTLLSVLIRSAAGAAGAGLGVFVLAGIAAVWRPLGEYTPAGLPGIPGRLAAGEAVAWVWPVVGGLLLAVALVAAAAAIFRRTEL